MTSKQKLSSFFGEHVTKAQDSNVFSTQYALAMALHAQLACVARALPTEEVGNYRKQVVMTLRGMANAIDEEPDLAYGGMPEKFSPYAPKSAHYRRLMELIDHNAKTLQYMLTDEPLVTYKRDEDEET